MNGLIGLVGVILLVSCPVAGLMAIGMLVEEAARRGCPEDQKTKLWFIGIFATPLVLAGLVLAMGNDGPLNQKHPVKGAHIASLSESVIPSEEPKWDSEDLPEL